MAANTWSHRLVRPVSRLLVGTPVTPDQLTWLRLITGVLACVAFARGGRGAEIVAGVIWTISALLDRADGELARLSNRASHAGYCFDSNVDVAVNVAMFVAVGIGLRNGPFGPWAIALGLICGLGLFLTFHWSAEIEDRLEPGTIVLPGAGGFDPDDMFYLIGPLAWAGWLNLMLATAGLVLVPAATAVGIWRWRAGRRARLSAPLAEPFERP